MSEVTRAIETERGVLLVTVRATDPFGRIAPDDLRRAALLLLAEAEIEERGTSRAQSRDSHWPLSDGDCGRCGVTMDQHTPGKVHWEIWDAVYPDGYIDRLVQEGGRVILRHKSIRPMEPEDRRRIAACWNACEEAGIPTEALESGVVRELVEALEALVGEIEWEIGEEKWGRDPDALPMARAVLAKVRGEA